MKKINILLLILTGAFLFSSCEKEDRRYQGPLFVEFAPDAKDQSTSGMVKEAALLGLNNIQVQLIGLAQNRPITVNFRVADQVFYIISLDKYVFDLPNGLQPSEYTVIKSTAVYNTDYTFNGLSGITFNTQYGRGSIVIPAGSQFGTIPVNVIQKEGTRVLLVLEDSEDIRVNKPTALLRYEMSRIKTFVYEESFGSDPLIDRGWSEIDKDGDGYTWEWWGGTPSMTSDSYRGGVDIDPENYLVSPAITIPASVAEPTLSFEVASGAGATSLYYKERYTVLISEVPITFDNCRTVPVLQAETELTEANRGRRFTTVNIDLTPHRGKTVYFSIAHKNSFGQNYILVRNLSVYHY